MRVLKVLEEFETLGLLFGGNRNGLEFVSRRTLPCCQSPSNRVMKMKNIMIFLICFLAIHFADAAHMTGSIKGGQGEQWLFLSKFCFAISRKETELPPKYPCRG
jgi:hypothetical protein